jgi:hypothetical protein
MTDSIEREEGPLAKDLDPTIPANPRHGTRTIVATTAECGRYKLSRVGLTADDAVDEELDDYRRGLGTAKGEAADAYARDQPDVALWEGERCLAVIRPRPGGDPEVTRFDGADDGRPLPCPSTDLERIVWGMVKEHGADACREALCGRFYPELGAKPARALTPAEESILYFARTIGEGAAMDRLLMAGPYGAIRDAIDRLGTDAVAELRRIIAAGSAPVSVEAGSVVEQDDQVEQQGTEVRP